MELLLDKRYYQKLEILKYLSRHPEAIFIDTLCEFLDLSRLSIRRLLASLDEDLSLVINKEIRITTKESYYQLSTVATNHPTVDTIEKLTLYYLKRSISFQFLWMPYSTHYQSANSLMDELLISSSYFYKTHLKVSKILKGWHIKIDFSTKSENFNFLGRQEHLRFFFIYFYWNAFKQQEWPFTKIDFEVANKYLSYEKELTSVSIPSTKLRGLQMYLSITAEMILAKKQLVELTPDTRKIIQGIETIHDLSSPINQIFNNSPKFYTSLEIEDEKMFFNFVLRFIASDTDNACQRIEIGRQFLNVDNTIIQNSKSLLNGILREFRLDFSDETYADMFYYVTLYLLAFENLNIDFLSFYRPHPKVKKISIERLESESVSNDIKKYVADFLHEHTDFPRNRNTENTNDILYNLIYFIVFSLKKNHYKVFIQCSKNIHSEAFIKQKLESLFGNEILSLTSNINESDLIISDCNELDDYGDKQFFYFEFTHDLNTWNQLVGTIQAKLMKLAFTF